MSGTCACSRSLILDPAVVRGEWRRDISASHLSHSSAPGRPQASWEVCTAPQKAPQMQVRVFARTGQNGAGTALLCLFLCAFGLLYVR